ncbi:glycosyltransferase family 4 protein [Rhodococcus aerolatus]
MTAATDGPLRVLHLGFEDPLRPGAGGGSRRTHEVNRRLADSGVQVTVLCAAYPGARAHVDDGVAYRPLGRRLLARPIHPFLAQLGYFLVVVTTLWWQVRRHRPDVVVEDFAAPFSSVAVPRLTRVPVVGVVQWLFAAQKARQYHLPFDRVEALGLASHRRLVAVSEDLATELRARNPRAEVTAVPNGVETRAAAGGPVLDAADRTQLVYLGRIEVEQKGLDLLLEAYAAVADRVSADLWLAGDGPDVARVRALAAQHGVAERVHLLGAVAGSRRFDLLAQARLLVVPSRYETFGMVAAEALSVGTPVLAFDIPCLAELVGADVGRTVAPFEVAALGAELAALAADPALCRRLGDAGPASVAHLDWDLLAARQLAVYRAAVAA